MLLHKGFSFSKKQSFNTELFVNTDTRTHNVLMSLSTKNNTDKLTVTTGNLINYMRGD